MSTPDERRAIKARAPVTRLLDLHTHDCRVVPDREALLEAVMRFVEEDLAARGK